MKKEKSKEQKEISELKEQKKRLETNHRLEIKTLQKTHEEEIEQIKEKWSKSEKVPTLLRIGANLELDKLK